MKLRRIDAARDIADIVSSSGNKVYLNADSLLLNLLGDADDKFEKSVGKKSRWLWRKSGRDKWNVDSRSG